MPLIGTTKTLMLGQLSFAIFPYIFITASNIQIFFLSSIPLSIAAGLFKGLIGFVMIMSTHYLAKKLSGRGLKIFRSLNLLIIEKY